MQSRNLGRTSVRVTEVALGTWGLASQSYGPVDGARFEATVKAAWEHGVRTFDVAPTWGDGESERRTALALGPHLNDAVFVGRAGQVKVDGRILAQFDTYMLVREVEASLRRLGRDHLDVLLLHHPPPKVLTSHLWSKAITQLEEQGKIRAWGVAVGGVDDARVAAKQGAQVLSFTHNLLTPDDLLDLVEVLQQTGAGVLARSPLAHGMLAGTWTTDTRFGADDHRARRWESKAFATRLAQLHRLRFLVKDGVPDLASAALRYALATPFVSSLLVGARTPEQIAHAAKAIPDEPPYLPTADFEKLAEYEL